MDSHFDSYWYHRSQARHDFFVGRARGTLSCHSSPGATIYQTIISQVSLLLQLENCQVTANVQTVRKDASVYHAVQVAASDRPPKTTTRAMRGHFSRAGVTPKRIVTEFPVTEDAHVPVGARQPFLALLSSSRIVGTTFSAAHFVPGQYVDVIANSCVVLCCSRKIVPLIPSSGSGKVMQGP